MNFQLASLKFVGFLSFMAGIVSLALAAGIPAYGYLMSLDAAQREKMSSVVELIIATAGDSPLGRWAANPISLQDLHRLLAALPYEAALPAIGLLGVLAGLTIINRAEIVSNALMPDPKKKDYVASAHRDASDQDDP